MRSFGSQGAGSRHPAALPPDDFLLVLNVRSFLTTTAESARKLKQMEQDMQTHSNALTAAIDAVKSGRMAAGSEKWAQQTVNALQKAIETEQVLTVHEASKMIPSHTVMMHALLQKGVQSGAVREALEAAVANAKEMETDPHALNLSTRMWKAATSQILVLVGFGEAKQVAWADTPEPFQTFEAMFAAAGGSVERIIQIACPDPTDPRQAESEYIARMKRAEEERKAKDERLWAKVLQMCEANGVEGLGKQPFWPLTDSTPTDRKGRAAITTVLTDLGITWSWHASSAWKFSAHRVRWLYPWTEHLPNRHNKSALSSAQELIMFSKLVQAACAVMAAWDAVQLSQYLELSEETVATLKDLQMQNRMGGTVNSNKTPANYLCLVSPARESMSVHAGDGERVRAKAILTLLLLREIVTTSSDFNALPPQTLTNVTTREWEQESDWPRGGASDKRAGPQLDQGYNELEWRGETGASPRATLCSQPWYQLLPAYGSSATSLRRNAPFLSWPRNTTAPPANLSYPSSLQLQRERAGQYCCTCCQTTFLHSYCAVLNPSVRAFPELGTSDLTLLLAASTLQQPGATRLEIWTDIGGLDLHFRSSTLTLERCFVLRSPLIPFTSTTVMFTPASNSTPITGRGGMRGGRGRGGGAQKTGKGGSTTAAGSAAVKLAKRRVAVAPATAKSAAFALLKEASIAAAAARDEQAALEEQWDSKAMARARDRRRYLADNIARRTATPTFARPPRMQGAGSTNLERAWNIDQFETEAAQLCVMGDTILNDREKQAAVAEKTWCADMRGIFRATHPQVWNSQHSMFIGKVDWQKLTSTVKALATTSRAGQIWPAVYELQVLREILDGPGLNLTAKFCEIQATPWQAEVEDALSAAECWRTLAHQFTEGTMTEQTASKIKHQIQLRCSARWMKPEDRPTKADEVWAAKLMQEAERHFHVEGVMAATQQILQTGAMERDAIKKLQDALREVEGLGELLANPAWCANIFSGGKTEISPSHPDFGFLEPVGLHWFNTNTQVAKLTKEQFETLWTAEVRAHSMDQMQAYSTSVHEAKWYKGADTAAKCIPPVLVTTGGHAIGTSTWSDGQDKLLRGEAVFAHQGMPVGVALDTPIHLCAELESSSVSAFLALAEKSNMDQPEAVRRLFRSLASQLPGLASVVLSQCSFKPGAGPHKFWEWFSQWVKALLGFTGLEHRTTALSRTQELYIFDGPTLDESLLTVRTFFVSRPPRKTNEQCDQRARVDLEEHLHITNFNTNTLSVLGEETGKTLHTMEDRQNAFKARLSPFGPIETADIELVTNGGGRLKKPLELRIFTENMGDRREPFLAAVLKMLQTGKTEFQMEEYRLVGNHRPKSLKVTTRNPKKATAGAAGAAGAAPSNIALPNLSLVALTLEEATEKIAEAVQKHAKVLLPEYGQGVLDQPTAPQTGTVTLHGALQSTTTEAALRTLDLDAVLIKIDKTKATFTRTDWIPNSGDVRLLVDWTQEETGGYIESDAPPRHAARAAPHVAAPAMHTEAARMEQLAQMAKAPEEIHGVLTAQLATTRELERQIAGLLKDESTIQALVNNAESPGQQAMQEAKLAEVQAKGHRATAGLEEARRIGSAAEALLQKSSPGHLAQWQVEREQPMTGEGADGGRGGGPEPRTNVRSDDGAPQAADSAPAQMQGALQQKPGGALAQLYKAGSSFFSSGPKPAASSGDEFHSAWSGAEEAMRGSEHSGSGSDRSHDPDIDHDEAERQYAREMAYAEENEGMEDAEENGGMRSNANTYGDGFQGSGPGDT